MQQLRFGLYESNFGVRVCAQHNSEVSTTLIPSLARYLAARQRISSENASNFGVTEQVEKRRRGEVGVNE